MQSYCCLGLKISEAAIILPRCRYMEKKAKRVERHRRLRAGKGFITSEQTVQIEQALKNLKTVIRCHMQHLLNVCLILLPMKCSMKMDSEARTKL